LVLLLRCHLVRYRHVLAVVEQRYFVLRLRLLRR
jgi:hypothetical protein